MLPKLNTYIIKQTCFEIYLSKLVHTRRWCWISKHILRIEFVEYYIGYKKKSFGEKNLILKTHKQRKTTELKSLHTNHH